MKYLRYLFLLLIVISASACTNPFSTGAEADFFHISRNNAVMPVWVRGNAESEIYIVVLYGGPGGSSTAYWGTDTFELLEKDYRIVYWDQRSSGFSSGTSTSAEMSPEEAALDTDLLIDVIKSLYSPSDIFLYGHSWGGLLGTVYLKDSERQKKITGWIDVAGGHNWPLGMELSVEFVRDYAESQIGSGNTPTEQQEKWLNVLKWYDENPLESWETPIPSSWSMHVEYVWESYGYVTADYLNEVIDQASSSEINIHTSMNYTPEWSWFTLMPKIWTYDATPGMEKILLPTKLIWGINDGILPVELAQDAYDRIGTPAQDKSITILNNSAHWIVDEQGEALYQAIKDFIGTYSS